MKKLLLAVLLTCPILGINSTAFAADVRVDIQFNANVGRIQSEQIYFAKIDGVSVQGKCKLTKMNQSACVFERLKVNTYDGLNVVFAFSDLNNEIQSIKEHGTISTFIDGEFYNQITFTLDMKSKRGSFADVSDLGVLIINY